MKISYIIATVAIAFAPLMVSAAPVYEYDGIPSDPMDIEPDAEEHTENQVILPPEILFEIAKNLDPKTAFEMQLANPSIAREGYSPEIIASTLKNRYPNNVLMKVFEMNMPHELRINVFEYLTKDSNDAVELTELFNKASENGYAEIIKLLLTDPRVNPAAGNNHAIKWASYYGRTEVVKLLLTDPRVNPAAGDNFAIQLASLNGRTEVVKILLNDPRVDPSANSNYAIKWASRYGHTEIVKLLLKDPRVDPTANSNEAIRWASQYGRTEVVKLLLNDDRVDPSADGNYAIRWASQNGHAEVVKLLLNDPRVDPADDGNYAIRWASSRGHAEVVKLLEEHNK